MIKKTVTLWMMTLAVILTYQSSAQQVEPRSKAIKQFQSHKSKVEASRLEVNYTPVSKPETAAKSLADTLNYPLEGTVTLYAYEGGYVSGTNDYFDKAKANIFQLNQPRLLTGVLIDFGVAKGGNTPVEVAVWESAKSPGNKVGSQMVNKQTIINDINNQQTTFINFENPLVVFGEFYVGVVLPTEAGDTIAILTNSDGDTNPATAWEQWADDSWFAYDNGMSWGYKISHAIFPIVEPGDYLVADFTASATSIGSGETVQFTDQSFGNPDTWQWTFEGGEPASSNLQNPLVTYPNQGMFDVTLTITKGAESSTRVKSSYIEAHEGDDTLNFPLPGEYTLYVLNEGGGYVSGNNAYGDKAVVNKFSLGENGYVKGILTDFAIAVGGNPEIEVNLFNSDLQGAPGAKLASNTVALNTIKEDIANEQLTYVPFNPPVSVGQNFFAGYIFPTAAGDTLVVWGNSDGDTNPGSAWTLFSDNTWIEFSDPNNWSLDIALGIHPVVQYSLGIHEGPQAEEWMVYPNPANNDVYLTWQDQNLNPLFRLLTINGQMIREMEQQGSASSVRFDISELQPGVYILQMITYKGISNQKFVKD